MPRKTVPDETRDKILNAYTDPAKGLDGMNTFARRERIPLSEVRNVLRGEEPYSLNVYTRETFPRRKIILNHIDETWSADLMDVQRNADENDGIRFLLIVVDGMSKYVWAIPLKNKEASTTEADLPRVEAKTTEPVDR